jgi:hypothetical protein
MPWPKGKPLPTAVKERIARAHRGVTLPSPTKAAMAVVSEASVAKLHKLAPTSVVQRVVIRRPKRRTA